MDLVEIVVEIEERFGLKMTSEDWQSLGQKATVRDLADWIWEHLPPERRGGDERTNFSAVSDYKMLEAAAFAWLQVELQQILRVEELPAVAFPPDLALTRLPGRPRMRWLYAQLRARKIRLPPLFPSPREYAIARWIGLATAAGGFAKGWSSGNLNIVEMLAATVIPGLIAWAIVQSLISHYYANTSTADTVGELAGQLLSRNPSFFSQGSAIRLTREQVDQIVIQILIETLGVDRDEVKLDAQLIADLNME
jgi:acyl carrier protein